MTTYSGYSWDWTFGYADGETTTSAGFSSGGVTITSSSSTLSAGSTFTATNAGTSYNCTYIGTVDIDGTTAILASYVFDGITYYIVLSDTSSSIAIDVTSAVNTSASWDLATGTDSSCFLAGTSISTPEGEVVVESLKPGDLVLTADGQARPVRWLGRQSISVRFADPLRVTPIRIKAGALGNDLPRRDLLTSPDHALLVDNILVQAGALVNHVSILREAEVPESFVYYHVELADHELILAEGTPAETFIDNASRLGFDNWAEHDALDGADKPMVELALPRAKSYRQVPQALRARLCSLGAELYGMKETSVA